MMSILFMIIVFKSGLPFHESSQTWMFFKIGALKNFRKFTGKLTLLECLFNKAAGVRPATLLKKRLQCRYFSVNFTRGLQTLLYRTPPNNCFCF